MNQIVEQLKKFLESDSVRTYRLFYYHNTGKRLETVEQIIDAIVDEKFTFEDVFMERMNHIGMTYNEECYWEDNMEKFDYKVYFPEDKNVGSGSWIKVKTETGYEVHWAKKSTRKYRWREKMEDHMKKSISGMNADRLKKHSEALTELTLRWKIGLPLYEVFYYRTKTKKAYVTPDQYEICDVDEVIGWLMDKVPTVKVKSLFTAVNKEVIFYMMQRGIPKQLAMVMSNLKQCYFTVDVEKSLKLYNEQWNKMINYA